MTSLSPPWYTLRLKFVHTFGVDPDVKVGPLDVSQDTYILPIIVDEKAKGMALRTIIRTNFNFGNVNVATVVKNSQGIIWSAVAITTPDDLLGVLNAAFKGNKLCADVIPRDSAYYGTQVGLIMTKTVVQFYNGDIKEFYGNFNDVTAHVVAGLITLWYGSGLSILMGTSTATVTTKACYN